MKYDLIFLLIHDTIKIKQDKNGTMAISHKILFHLMIAKEITNAELMKKDSFNTNIITLFKCDNYVALDSIEKICYSLDCDVNDILEFIPDEKEKEKHG